MKIKSFSQLAAFIFYLFLIVAFSCSSPKQFTIRGTVQEIQRGKDGYTATLKDDGGNNFDAVISRVTLGDQYRELTAGERVEVSGDTMQMDHKLTVMVKKFN